MDGNCNCKLSRRCFSAGAYESFDSQNWLSDNVNIFWSKEFWNPPNSPDLNPLDYYVWSVVERVRNKSRHPVTSLRTAIKATFVDMDSAILQRVYEYFEPRIEAVIQTNGEYIE